MNSRVLFNLDTGLSSKILFFLQSGWPDDSCLAERMILTVFAFAFRCKNDAEYNKCYKKILKTATIRYTAI